MIAGFPAELRTIDLRTLAGERPRTFEDARPQSIELFVVADLATRVDRSALLRSEDPETPPYWALTWIGARALAARLAAAPAPATARVLDLGCGLGLAGVVAGRSGASITFADHIDAALDFAEASARYHGLVDFHGCLIDFTKDSLADRFDLILAADVVYEPADYAPLVAFLTRHLAPAGSILLTESLRADARAVTDALVRSGLTIETEAVWVEEDGRAERTWLHTLRALS